MGIAKSIGVGLWKFLKLSTITTYTFVRKYPFVSGILVLAFLLYIFVPYVFFIVVCSSPFLVLVVLLVYFKYKRPKPQNVKQVEKKEPEVPSRSVSLKDNDIIILRNNGTAISRQMSRRRNFKDRNRLDCDAGKDDDLVSLTASLRELLGLTSQFEGKPKVRFEVKKSRSLNKKEGSAREKVLTSETWSKPDFTSHCGFVEQPHKFDGNGGKLNTESKGEAKDDKKAPEYRKKLIEYWTKSEHKNLMDLRISEIESNKRLEVLIAKRRARKLMKMQDVKSLIGIDTDSFALPELEIAPISVSRTDDLDPLAGEVSPLPGSAPPILLPVRNPFDLPYDPLEEKPNLRGDSFLEEEITTTQQKDMLLCRHESFHLGPSFPLEPKQDLRDGMFGPYFGTAYRESEVLGYPKSRMQPKKDDHDRLGEQLLSLEDKSISRNLNIQDIAEVEQAPNQETNPVELEREKDKETDNKTTQIEGQGVENAHNIESGIGKQSQVQIETDANNTTQSQGQGVENAQDIESRIGKQSQVQVDTDANDVDHSDSDSESSSGSSSSDEDDIFNANIAGVAVSLTSKGRNFPNVLQPLRRSLPSIPKNIPRKELACDYIPSAEDKARREDYLFFAERSFGHAHTHSVASDMQVEVSEGGSPPPIVNESFTYDRDNENENSYGSEDLWGASPRVGGIKKQQSSPGEVHDAGEEVTTEAGDSGASKSSVDQQDMADTNLLSPQGTEVQENRVEEDIGDCGESKLSLGRLEAEQLIDRLRIHPSHEVDSEKSEEQSYSTGRSLVNDNAKINDLNDKVTCEKEKSESVKDSEGESLDLIRQEADVAPQNLPEASRVDNSTHMEDIVGKSIKPSDDEAIDSLSKSVKENRNLSFIEDNEKLGKLDDHEDTNHPPKPSEADRKLESVEDAQGNSEMMESDAVADQSDPVIGSSKSDTAPTSVGLEPEYHHLQSSTPSDIIIDNLNQTLMSEIMNEDKSKSVGHGELVSQASVIEEPVSKKLTTIGESNSRSTRDIEGASRHSFDAIQSVKGESEGSIMDSAEMDNRVNHKVITELPKPTGSEVVVAKGDVNDGHKRQNKVESQSSTIEEPVPELLTSAEESNLRSTRDIESESQHSSEAIQSVKGESEALMRDVTKMNNLVNHELIAELSKSMGSEIMISEPEVNDGQKGHSEVDSSASVIEEHVGEPLTTVDESNLRSSNDIEDESKHSSEAIQSVEGESEALKRDSTEMNNQVNHELIAELPKQPDP